MKRFLTMLLLCFVCMPVQAATGPDDLVWVLYTRMHSDGAQVLEEKTYSKKWVDIRIGNTMRTKARLLNAQLDKSSGGIEKYKLAWIRIVDDEVQAFMFHGDQSSAWIVEPASKYNGNKDQFLSMTLNGNGNFGCFDNKPYID